MSRPTPDEGAARTVIVAHPHRARLTAALPLLVSLMIALVAGLSGCANLPGEQTVSIAAVFPLSGPDAALGQAMRRGVELVVRQHATPAPGYRLVLTAVDEATGRDGDMAALVANTSVMGIVGPLDSQTATAMLPKLAGESLVAISPGATLPGLTQADQAKAELLDFAQLHPAGKPVAFFRLPPTDATAGKVAADLARAPGGGNGFDAQSVFVVDDGTPSGLALAAAFRAELAAKQGVVAGTQTTITTDPASVQAAVTAIVRADPDLIFFAGGTVPAALLRATLTLSGAPQLDMLAVGHMVGNSAWDTTLAAPVLAGHTTVLAPAPALSTLAGAAPFIAAYRAAFGGQEPLPQSALAYDAAMDQITAITGVLRSGKALTRAGVLAAVAAAQYPGVTGTIAFDPQGDHAAPFGYSLYTCDAKGAWQFRAQLNP
jgi:branched-chain amino acid transport system substrate-binding protein